MFQIGIMRIENFLIEMAYPNRDFALKFRSKSPANFVQRLTKAVGSAIDFLHAQVQKKN